MKEKKPHYAKMDTSWLGPVLEHPAGALASHWVFQGLLAMDRTERAFKLGLDGILWLLLGGALRRVFHLPGGWAAGLGFLGAHTLNFLFNGQVFGVLKHYGGVRRSREGFNAEVEGLQERMAREPDIVYAAAYGSLARGAWSPTSDLDVRIVRAPGLRSAWRVSWFAVAERTRALWRRFPLDLLVLDSCDGLEQMAEKTPVVLSRPEAGALR